MSDGTPLMLLLVTYTMTGGVVVWKLVGKDETAKWTSHRQIILHYSESPTVTLNVTQRY